MSMTKVGTSLVALGIFLTVGQRTSYGQDCDLNGTPDANERVRFVDTSAIGGDNDGSTWDDAYTDLKDALDNTCANMPCYSVQIWVKTGTYLPTDSSLPDSRSESFDLCADLPIYGGFDGTEDPVSFDVEVDIRDFVTNETILSGDINQDDDTVGTSDNSYTVVWGNNGDKDTIVDGFTIRDGNANNTDTWDAKSYGGGIYINGGVPRFQNCIITDNSAHWGGGGAYIDSCNYLGTTSDVENAIFSDCSFEDNTATDGNGGGLVVRNSPTGEGEGSSFDPHAHPVLVRRCYFLNNSASANTAAGTRGGGGATFIHDAGGVQFRNAVFADNIADYGGAVAVWAVSNHTVGHMTNCTLTRNHARINGGAIEVSHEDRTVADEALADIMLKNSILWGNTVQTPSVAHGSQVAMDSGGWSVARVYTSDIEGGRTDFDDDSMTFHGAINYYNDNIETNPQFYGDFGQLQNNSPCIDAGDNGWVYQYMPTDILGNPRKADGGVNGEIVDMGAYELGMCPATDVNCDGSTNAGDLLVIRSPLNWDMLTDAAQNPCADVNADGDVNAGDLLAVRSPLAWNTTTGRCICPCDVAATGMGAASAPQAAPWTFATATATLVVKQIGGGNALSELAPNTTYELHYTTDHDDVNGYTLFAAATDPAEGLAAITAPASGIWSATGTFTEVDWTQTPSPLAGDTDIYRAAADTLPGTTLAGSASHIANITTGATGDITLLLQLTHTDFTQQELTEMPVTATYNVQ